MMVIWVGREKNMPIFTDSGNITVSHATILNPTSYFNGKRWAFEWSRDRALSRSVNRIDSDETDTSYNYDFDGVRTEKRLFGNANTDTNGKQALKAER